MHTAMHTRVHTYTHTHEDISYTRDDDWLAEKRFDVYSPSKGESLKVRGRGVIMSVVTFTFQG